MSELTPEEINVSTWKIPSPLGIIGSHANGEFNGMTASWITQVSMEPVSYTHLTLPTICSV